MSSGTERILDNIKWSIGNRADIAYKIDTRKSLTEAEWMNTVFPNDVTIRFLMDDRCVFYVDRELKGPSSLRQVITFIYNFYEERMPRELYPKVFEGREDYLEEILDEDETKYLKNVDAFDDACGLPFLGLTKVNETEEAYEVLIGPE